MNNMDILKEIEKLNLNDAVKVMDTFYKDRYTLSNYYEAYAFICEKFNIHGALLPHKEYRQK